MCYCKNVGAPYAFNLWQNSVSGIYSKEIRYNAAHGSAVLSYLNEHTHTSTRTLNCVLHSVYIFFVKIKLFPFINVMESRLGQIRGSLEHVQIYSIIFNFFLKNGIL